MLRLHPPHTGALDDIVVTARRSAESLQRVPVAITALSGDFIERQRLTDATELTRLAPNLLVAALPGNISGAAVYVRGIGNNEPSSVAEAGVGIYLDGVYLARSAGALFDVVDVERIEVLRGPQGTLFGRNTIGGAVQFVTKKPRDDFHFSAKAGYGRYNDLLLRTRIDTGLIGGTPIKLSFSGQHRQNDGYVNSLVTPGSRDPGATNNDSFVIAASSDLGSVTIDYSFDYSHRRGVDPFFQLVAASPDVQQYYASSPSFGGTAFQISPVRLSNVHNTGFLTDAGQRIFKSASKNTGHTLNLAYEVTPHLTFKSITGYRRFSQNTITDLSGNGGLRGVALDAEFNPFVTDVVPYTAYISPVKQRQFSQELQASGKFATISYLLGAYYFKEKSSEFNDQRVTFVLPGGQAGLQLQPVQAFNGTNSSTAIFGQVSWKPHFLEEKLELTGGLRYTHDSKSLTIAGDVQPSISAEAEFNNVSWLGSLSYQIDRDVMMYARASSGYRSGGINPRASVINTFAPEKVMSYEAGLKAELFDRQLRLNLAGFVTDYKDRQISQFAAGSGGATSLTVNAGKVKFQGFEGEMVWIPVKGLVFDASVGLVDTKYKQFLFRDPVTNVISDVRASAKATYTPKWTYHIGGEYHHELDSFSARVRVDYSVRTSIYFNALDNTTPFNEDIRSPTDKNLNARVSFEDIDMGAAQLEIGVWGNNLTNQQILNFGIDFGSLGFAGAVFKEPATYGIDAKISF